MRPRETIAGCSCPGNRIGRMPVGGSSWARMSCRFPCRSTQRTNSATSFRSVPIWRPAKLRQWFGCTIMRREPISLATRLCAVKRCRQRKSRASRHFRILAATRAIPSPCPPGTRRILPSSKNCQSRLKSRIEVADGVGFEPTIRDHRIHTFQACAFDRSATHPLASPLCSNRPHLRQPPRRPPRQPLRRPPPAGRHRQQQQAPGPAPAAIRPACTGAARPNLLAQRRVRKAGTISEAQ